MRSLLFVFGLAFVCLNVSSTASAYEYHLTSGCIDCFNFAAPSVFGASTVTAPGVGLIVYDTSTNMFKGYSSIGTWQTLTQAPTAIPSGSILPFAGTTAPSGFLLCDGSAVSRTTYAALFAVIGTTYGSGDGSTTFNVPNLKGVFLRGAGSQTISGITYSATLGLSQGDQMQGHVHKPSNSQSFWTVGSGGGWAGANNVGGGVTQTGSPVTDGTNGTPRTGAETRPANVAVNYIISQ